MSPRKREATRNRIYLKQEVYGQEQPAAAGSITEPSDGDDQGGEEISEDDPLDFLKGGVERLDNRRLRTLPHPYARVEADLISTTSLISCSPLVVYFFASPERSDLNATRSSLVKSSGCSHAAK